MPLSTSLLLVLLACGVDTPSPEQVATPISPSNVERLREIVHYPVGAYRIVRGPGANELTLFDFNGPADVIDAKVSKETFETLRQLVKDCKVTDLAFSRDGSRAIWNDAYKPVYTVQDIASGKTFDVEIGKYAGFAALSADGKQLAIGFTFWDPVAENHLLPRLFVKTQSRRKEQSH